MRAVIGIRENAGQRMTAIDEKKPHGSDFPWGLRFYSVLRFPLGLVGLPPCGEGGVFRGEGGSDVIADKGCRICFCIKWCNEKIFIRTA